MRQAHGRTTGAHRRTNLLILGFCRSRAPRIILHANLEMDHAMLNPIERNGKFTFIESALFPRPVLGREKEIQDEFSDLMETPLYALDFALSVALQVYRRNNLPTKDGIYVVARDGSRRVRWVSGTPETAMNNAQLVLGHNLGRTGLHALADLGFLFANCGELHVASQILHSLDRWKKNRSNGQHDVATKFAIDAVMQAHAVSFEELHADKLTVGHKCQSAASEGGRARKSSQLVQRKAGFIRRYIAEYRARHPSAPIKQIYRDFLKSTPAEYEVKLSRFYEIAAG